VRTAKVILNPYAGHWAGARLAGDIAASLAGAGVDHDLIMTEGPGHAIELARRARGEGYEIVIAAGGDGTVNEVLNGLVLARRIEIGGVVGTLGIIPIGTGNDFAETSGIPKSLPEVSRHLALRRTRLIDIARVNDRFFSNECGVGFGAQVAIEAQRLKRLRRFLVYLVAVFKALFRYRQPTMTLAWDGGQVTQRILMVSAGNGRRAGGGFYLTPEARLDDGLLDYMYADALSRPAILRLLPKAMKGTHIYDPAAHLGRTTRLVITSATPLPVHCDGEILAVGTQEVDIEVLPARLQLIS
jgi:YegS/Rv2252/BmrU family lipid kinase